MDAYVHSKRSFAEFVKEYYDSRWLYSSAHCPFCILIADGCRYGQGQVDYEVVRGCCSHLWWNAYTDLIVGLQQHLRRKRRLVIGPSEGGVPFPFRVIALSTHHPPHDNHYADFSNKVPVEGSSLTSLSRRQNSYGCNVLFDHLPRDRSHVVNRSKSQDRYWIYSSKTTLRGSFSRASSGSTSSS